MGDAVIVGAVVGDSDGTSVVVAWLVVAKDVVATMHICIDGLKVPKPSGVKSSQGRSHGAENKNIGIDLKKNQFCIAI